MIRMEWETENSPIRKRNDPRWIAILEKRERAEKRNAFLKIAIAEGLDAMIAGIASIILFAAISVIIYGLCVVA